LIEQGKTEQALSLKPKLEELENKQLHLPDYEQIIDFKSKKLVNVKYPSAIKNVNTYIEYKLQDGDLIRRTGQAFSYTNIDELIASSSALQNTTAQPQQTEIKDQTLAPSNVKTSLSKENIREELTSLKHRQTNRLRQLNNQSAILTKISSEKLDASNTALLDFELMREKYNAGELSDKKSILAKQTESQNLLYQSLAIKSFAEKTDSLILIIALIANKFCQKPSFSLVCRPLN